MPSPQPLFPIEGLGGFALNMIHIYLNFTRQGHGGPSFDHDGASNHTELMPPGKERSKLARAVFIPPTGKRGAWCEDKGIRHGGGANHFSAKIEAAVPTVTTARPRNPGSAKRPTVLFGIALLSLLDRAT